jgi:hypothetical protein
MALASTLYNITGVSVIVGITSGAGAAVRPLAGAAAGRGRAPAGRSVGTTTTTAPRAPRTALRPQPPTLPCPQLPGRAETFIGQAVGMGEHPVLGLVLQRAVRFFAPHAAPANLLRAGFASPAGSLGRAGGARFRLAAGSFFAPRAASKARIPPARAPGQVLVAWAFALAPAAAWWLGADGILLAWGQKVRKEWGGREGLSPAPPLLTSRVRAQRQPAASAPMRAQSR